MANRFELLVTGGAPASVLRLVADVQLLGSAEACQLRVDHPSVAPRHATVSVTPVGLMIRSLTGDGLSPGQPAECLCSGGQSVRVGAVTLEVLDTTTLPSGGHDPAAADTIVHPGVGSVIAGRYELTQFIARGGMGQVFRARHRELGKDFALKLMHQRFSADPALGQRFRREALAASRIGHPNIVDVVDFGSNEDGLFFFTMELLEGQTIAQLLRTHGGLAPERVVALGRQLATALVAAHSAGVVHRDLKPENLMLVQRPGAGEVLKVLDFGIARFVEPGTTDHKLTGSNAIMGTPQYMAPEQASALPADARADVYAMGLILYEMLTGQPTFNAPTLSLLLVEQIRQPAPALPPTVPPALASLIARMLHKRPEDRPQAMTEVLAALEAPALLTPSVSRAAWRRAPPWLVAAMSVVLGATLLLWARPVVVAQPPAPPAPAPAPVAAPTTAAPQAPVEAASPVQSPQLVDVALSSSPPGALVKVDGLEVGVTPLTLSRPLGTSARVVVSRPGFRPASLELRFDRPRAELLSLTPAAAKAAPAATPTIKKWDDSE